MALVEELVVGRVRRPSRAHLRRRLLRGLIAFGATALLLGWLTVLTARFAPAPTPPPAVGAVPFRSVPAWEQHLPYAAVDRASTVVRSRGARLDAWVLSPRGARGALPAVVLVGDAGSGTRDDLLPEADALARGGVVTLVYAKSTVGYSPLSRRYAGLAEDALAAVDLVSAWDDVDPDRVGLLGVGEGGAVAALATQRAAERVAFQVLVSAPLVSPGEQAAWTLDRALRPAPALVRRAAAVGVSASRGLLDYLDADVTPALASTRTPVYAVWGADDRTVPVATAVATLRSAAAGRMSAEIVGGAGHVVPLDSGWAIRVADWVRRAQPVDDQVRGSEPTSFAPVTPLPELWPLGDIRVLLGISVAAALLVGLFPGRSGEARRPRAEISASRFSR